MAVKRNISGVEYDVISPSYYVRHEPGMRILIGYTGELMLVVNERFYQGGWVTWINDEAVGRDLSLEAAGDAVAAGLHSYTPPKRAS